MTSLFQTINGSISVFFYFINTVFWFIPIIVFSFFKLIPLAGLRRLISKILDGCATNWISLNKLNHRLFSRTTFTISGLNALNTRDWYLVISNHQSWVDILVLQSVFNRKIPFLKFFLKKELIYVPILGLAWWALDFPFMRRYNKSYLAKHPHKKGKDLETTKKACRKFKHKPVSIMNFLEGTRSTENKLNRSQYQHLLPPKAGGIAFVLSAMGEQLTKLVDVTIFYPNGIPSYWDFVCGRVQNIEVHVEIINMEEIVNPNVFTESALTDGKKRTQFQRWLNGRWQRKDELLIERYKDSNVDV